MNYVEFKEAVIQALKCRTGASIINKVISKNNGVHLDSITIQREERKISPTIYLEHFWQDLQGGKNFNDIINEIISLDEKNQDSNLESIIEGFLCFDSIKDRISYKLVNYEKNAEILKRIPHRKYLDLAIVYQVVGFEKEKGMATILINNYHAEVWNVTEDTLYQIANKNSVKILPPKLESMNELLCEMGLLCSLPPEEVAEMLGEVVPMYVLTNEYKNLGAVCILYEGMLEDIYYKLGQGFYVLPSSIHETIIVPDVDKDVDSLHRIVKEVNLTQVEEEEFLADNVYLYTKERGLQIA